MLDPQALADCWALYPYTPLPSPQQRGTLQDAIDEMAGPRRRERFTEAELLRLFLGVCKGVQVMHQCSVRSGPW